MTDYGVLAHLVGAVTSLCAAGAAISFAFTKRAKWQPPEETVPAGVSRLAALGSVIGVAYFYVFGAELGRGMLAAIAAIGFGLAVLSLVVAIYINSKFSFYFPPKHVEGNRKLGGNQLTGEAAQIMRSKGLTVQQLFEDAQGDKDLVWTRDSQAGTNIKSVLSFVALIVSGSNALAAAGTLIMISIGKD